MIVRQRLNQLARMIDMINHDSLGFGGIPAANCVNNVTMPGIGLQDLVISDQNAELQPINTVGNPSQLFT